MVVALQQSRFLLPVFALGALLMVVGTALSFYAGKLAFHRQLPAHHEALGVPTIDDSPDEGPVDAFGATAGDAPEGTPGG